MLFVVSGAGGDPSPIYFGLLKDHLPVADGMRTPLLPLSKPPNQVPRKRPLLSPSMAVLLLPPAPVWADARDAYSGPMSALQLPDLQIIKELAT
jgi:hypothetical protein